MNAFYRLPRWQQWTVAILLLLLMLLVMGGYFWLLDRAILVGLLFFFLAVPIFQFCFAPLMTLTGTYRYLSPMLLVYSPSDKKYDLHNGTSFDYLMVMRKVPLGLATQQTILRYYIQGLLEIVRQIEAEEIPESIRIEGTSYFFSESTAKRLGFNILPPDSGLRINLYLNYLDLWWMYCYAKGKLAFPRLKEAKKASIIGADLLAQKSYLQRLHQALVRRNELVRNCKAV